MFVGCAASQPPHAKSELELAPAPTSATPEAGSAADRETSARPTPPELQPCSEANPGGCRAPKAPRAKLDPNQRYAVAVRVDDPALGPTDASVTLVVFSDFQCPFCSQLEPVIGELRKRFPSQLKVVWKDLPLSIHPFATPAALLSREAYIKYGNERFWHVHDELFVHQAAFDDTWFAEFAKAEQLTWPPSEMYLARVEQSLQQADELSIGATPTVFVNGRPVVGAEHVSVYTDLINEELGQ
jgi:protein-disulfide isomerase